MLKNLPSVLIVWIVTNTMNMVEITIIFSKQVILSFVYLLLFWSNHKSECTELSRFYEIVLFQRSNVLWVLQRNSKVFRHVSFGCFRFDCVLFTDFESLASHSFIPWTISEKSLAGIERKRSPTEPYK